MTFDFVNTLGLRDTWDFVGIVCGLAGVVFFALTSKE